MEVQVLFWAPFIASSSDALHGKPYVLLRGLLVAYTVVAAVFISSRLRYWIVVALLTEAYFIVGKLSLMLASVHPSASPVWPPTGLALAMLLLLGVRCWPAILAGAFLVNVTTDGNAATSAVIALGNTLEAVVGVLLVERFAGGVRAFERVQNVIAFTVLAALASPVVSASFGVGSLFLAGSVSRETAGTVWFTWWLGDMVGAITVTPFIVLWGRHFFHRRTRWQWTEMLLLVFFLFCIGAIVFSPMNLPLAYLMLLPILWAAIRFGPRETSAVVLLISCIAIAGTLSGAGQFAVTSSNSSLLLLQSFVSVYSFVGMALGAAILERKEFERSLERKVEERAKEAIQARAQDRANLERLRNMLNHMTVATIALDEHLKILHINGAFYDLFHVKSRTNGAESLSDLFAHIRTEFLQPYETVDGLLQILSDRRKTIGRELTLKDGVGIYCDYIPVFDEGKHRGHLFIFRETDSLLKLI